MTIGQLMVALLAFIAIHVPGANIPVSQTPPVQFDSYVHYRAMGRARPADMDSPRTLAFYDHRRNIIVLDRAFDERSVRDQGILLHELVHWVQDYNGYSAENTCIGRLEGEAYKMQERFAREKGRPELIPDPFFVAIISLNCNNLIPERSDGF